MCLYPAVTSIIFLEISYDLFQNNEHTFEMIVKDWFRHGAQRLKKEQMASGMFVFCLLAPRVPYIICDSIYILYYVPS